jgi:hypothetical protein
MQRYNPELQRRSLENRKEKQENFNEWVAQLKKHSKSDLPRKSHHSLFHLQSWVLSFFSLRGLFSLLPSLFRMGSALSSLSSFSESVSLAYLYRTFAIPYALQLSPALLEPTVTLSITN